MLQTFFYLMGLGRGERGFCILGESISGVSRNIKTNRIGGVGTASTRLLHE